MNIEKRRAEIAARKAEIRKLIEGDTENKLNMDDLEKELRELNEEDEKLEKRQAIERMLNGGAAPASPAGLANPVARSANQPAPENSDVLYRSAWLKTLQGKPLTDDEKRAYSTASGSGLATNSIDYLGACVFDSKPVAGFGAFVHLAKATA